VKLLLDQNLSPSLALSLGDLFPGTVHVRDLGLSSAPDSTVWDRARSDGLCIVSKDADFHQFSFLLGAPPKVVWIQRGNCTTADIAALLREHHAALEAFAADPEAAFLAIR
jgi:predicted nuclease of predicted toxin-antitoxin system